MNKLLGIILTCAALVCVIFIGRYINGRLSSNNQHNTISSGEILDTVRVMKEPPNNNIVVKEIYKDGVKYLVFSNGQDIFIVNAKKEELKIKYLEDKLEKY